MSTVIEHLAVLYNNPFNFAPALAEFYNEYGNANRSMLLAYLILPLILPKESRKYLRAVRTNSSLRVLVSERDRIYGLAARVQQYRHITDKTLQYLVDANVIEIGHDLNIVVRGQVSTGVVPEGTIDAARGLAKICRPYDVQTVYRMLGVKSL
ncbi:MAG: DUF6521 family protein [Desulfuromonadaceae bacterium]|nr:DUF6521 family protein [Desulfuromonadaceae bacterium]